MFICPIISQDVNPVKEKKTSQILHILFILIPLLCISNLPSSCKLAACIQSLFLGYVFRVTFFFVISYKKECYILYLHIQPVTMWGCLALHALQCASKSETWRRQWRIHRAANAPIVWQGHIFIFLNEATVWLQIKRDPDSWFVCLICHGLLEQNKSVDRLRH